MTGSKPTMHPRHAHVLGAAVSMSWRDGSKSLTELIFAGVSAALRDADMPIAEVDSVVLAAHDLIDGRSLSSMVTAPAAGAYLRDEIRLSDDGLTALSLAAARVEAGESEVSIAAAWGRASEGGYVDVSRASMDPFLQQPLGMSEIDVSAFRLSRWLSAHAGAASRQQAVAARRARAAANPRALTDRSIEVPLNRPLDAAEGPRWADVVVCMLVGARPSPFRVAGVGHGTDTPQIGDRDLLAMPALREAVRRALSAADVALDAIGIIELDGFALSDEAIAMEALGLCPPGAGFRAYAETGRVNPSGGGEAGWCFPAMGLVRAAEGYLRLREAGGPGRALVVGHGAGGAQTTTAIVLEAS